MNHIINYYMEHSKNKVILCMILGIMEFMNAPLKLLFLSIPLGVYIFALWNRDRMMLSIIPKAIQPMYELCINILLMALFVLLLIAVIASVGRSVYNRETALFIESFQNSQAYQYQSNLKLDLIYKRKRNGITVRKIYSHIEKGKWNERSADILQKFNAHFEKGENFHYAKGNSLIIIMRTADGIEKPIKTEWHDDALEKDLEEL
ncbi:MAG: hypothetical protein NC548_42275 [Lachnospiraceae bacterium]|nr:hypothetical protein [Lachnospiraceae bacterium]